MSDRQVNLGLVNGNRNEPKPILRLGGPTITCSALTRVTLAHAHRLGDTDGRGQTRRAHTLSLTGRSTYYYIHYMPKLSYNIILCSISLCII